MTGFAIGKARICYLLANGYIEPISKTNNWMDDLMPQAQTLAWQAEPRNSSKVLRAWESFLSGSSKAEETVLRPVVQASWQRCRGVVNPLNKIGPDPMGMDALKNHQRQNQDLFWAVKTVMDQASEVLTGTGLVMLITDAEGVILGAQGDFATRSKAENVHLMPGSKWTESQSGTNAIGTTLAVGHGVQIHASEHFCSLVQGWTCTAMPIRDTFDNRLLGVVDISGLSKTYAHQNWPLVAMMAARIQSLLKKRALDYRSKLIEHLLMSDFASQAIVLYDRHGRRITANESAQNLLHEHNVYAAANCLDTLLQKTGHCPSGMDLALGNEHVSPIYDEGHIIGSILRLPRQLRDSTRGTAPKPDHPAFEDIIGNSAAINAAKKKTELLAKGHVPVLINGATGTGKERFARALHKLACHAKNDSKRPFIAMNCGALAPELLASELFGYADGAFTGARRGGQIGKLEAANGGTLFLDEIGEMPFTLQAHLLRALEEGELYRIGDTVARKLNFKLISATNRNLLQEVENGSFRRDLYFRLAVTTLELPSLCTIPEDIDILCKHYLKEFALRDGTTAKNISAATKRCLQAYSWPGNIRELKNALESMVIMAGTNTTIEPSDLPAQIRPHNTHPCVANQDNMLADAQLSTIIKVLHHNHGNLSRCARELGIAKSTLYIKLKKYALDDLVKDLRAQYKT